MANLEMDHGNKERVFIKDNNETWKDAVVLEKSKTEAICRLANGDKVVVRLKDYKNSVLPRMNDDMVADLVDMKHLHEPGVLANLVWRHERGKPYTRTRDVVISMNPFQWFDYMYSESVQNFYSKKIVWQISEEDPRQGLEPHIYEVSAMAYSELAFQRINQSILITGESGSGKTEAAKLIMHHIAKTQLGPVKQCHQFLNSSNPKNKDLQGFNNIVSRILNTNPLLEAFGNSFTEHNDNSSRFGKYVQLQFEITNSEHESYNIRSKSNCVLVGSICDVYLLETSRVCSHASNERTYHIFYQILAASDDQKSLIWHGIKNRKASDFKYTTCSPSTEKIKGINDSTKFNETWSAISQIGIQENEKLLLMQAVCLVLQLGNIEFIVDPTCDDKAILSSHYEFSLVCELLGLDEKQLLVAFTERSMTTRNETFRVPLSASSACDARDALAKDVYSNTFAWLISTINTLTYAQNTEKCSHVGVGMIGILDIFGFESFSVNRFEQLCINYANEKLHQKAINDIFRFVRDEYSYEGIPIDLVEVVSNEELLHLFEGRRGIMALLNEEIYRPKGTSMAFTAKVIENFKSTSFVLGAKHGIKNQFGIVHYAGTVFYTTDNFLNSNQDTLPLDLKNCISKCINPIIMKLQDPREDKGLINTDNDRTTQPSHFTPKFQSAPKSSVNVGNLECGRKLSSGKKWELAQEVLKSQSKGTIGSSKMPETKRLETAKDKNIDSLSKCIRTETNRYLRSNMCVKTYEVRNQDTSQDAILQKSTSTAFPDKSYSTALSKSLSSQPQANSRQQPSHSDLMAATVWTKYRTQMSTLLEKLNETKSRYVRCIKPNTNMCPKISDRHKVLMQLRYTGVVSTVTLSRALYSNSISNKTLSIRYRFLWDVKKYPSLAKRIDSIETKRNLECKAILKSIVTSFEVAQKFSSSCTETLYVVGKTRSYFRQGILEFLDAKRLFELEKRVIMIQKYVRGVQIRTKTRIVNSAVRTINFWYRKMKKISLIKRNEAAICIQKYFRGYIARQNKAKAVAVANSLKLIELERNSTTIQKYVRGVQVRIIYGNIVNAIKVIHNWYYKVKLRKIQIKNNAAKMIQTYYRGFLSRRNLPINGSIFIERNAIIIQSYVRRFLCRTKKLKVLMSIKIIHGWYRSIQVKRLERMNKAAKCIQNSYIAYRVKVRMTSVTEGDGLNCKIGKKPSMIRRLVSGVQGRHNGRKFVLFNTHTNL